MASVTKHKPYHSASRDARHYRGSLENVLEFISQSSTQKKGLSAAKYVAESRTLFRCEGERSEPGKNLRIWDVSFAAKTCGFRAYSKYLRSLRDLRGFRRTLKQ